MYTFMVVMCITPTYLILSHRRAGRNAYAENTQALIYYYIRIYVTRDILVARFHISGEMTTLKTEDARKGRL